MRQLKITRSVTQRDNRSLSKYLTEIGQVDLLSAEEEVELAKKIKHGDEEALHKLVKANLRFVVSVAKQYRDSYLSLNDLINEGNLGLITAAQKFDETRGFKFISYAIWWIRQSILKALAEQSRLIRLPLNRISSINKLNKEFSALEQKFGREPSLVELSEEMKIDEQEMDITMKATAKHLSLDETFGEEDEVSLHDILKNGEAAEPNTAMVYGESLKIDTSRALSSLSERQKEVVQMYFGLESGQTMTLEDIGNKFGLNKERIRQIKERALHKMRVASNGNMLKEYLCH